MNTPRLSPQQEAQLMSRLWELRDDLEAWVLFTFPWGQKGTPLASENGPRKWQREELRKISAHIQENHRRKAQGLDPLVYQSATVSGRGVGKSSLVAWLTLWMMSCQLGSSTVVTANTEDQLKSKTWGELGKWHTLSINSHWFDKSALSLKPQEWLLKELKRDIKIDNTYYYANATLWDDDNADAFAGLHNTNGILLIFDEASGIPKPIWDVSIGFFTEPSIYRFWFVFSNGRRNTGPFFECFHADRKNWQRRNIDSRSVEGVDKTLLNQIIEKHGDDSDQARIEVKGEFPRQGDKQFISRDIVLGSVEREPLEDQHAALIMGVDPARYGDDSTVIRFRQGRNARVIPPIKLKGADNMEVANKCAELIHTHKPDAVCIDAGNGTGIIDRLREMKFKVYEVWFGSGSGKEEYANKRTELWADMRDWLGGGCIDQDQDLIDDLTSPEYKFMGRSDKIILESKEEMKKKGFASPDNGDALACTFFIKVARKDASARRSRGARFAKDLDYKVFG